MPGTVPPRDDVHPENTAGALAGDASPATDVGLPLGDSTDVTVPTHKATLFLDAQLHVRRFTRGIETLFDLQPGDHGRPIGALMLGLDYSTLEQDARAVLHSGNPVEREVGTLQGGWFRLRVAPHFDADHEGDGVAVTFTDITQRKRGEQAQHPSDAGFRMMFNATSVGMSQSDPETRRFLRVNEALCTITGYSEAELLAMTVDDLNHPDDRERDRAIYEGLLRGTGPYTVEKRYRRKDGTEGWVHVTSDLMRDVEGRPQRAMAVILDISARKAVEEALRKSEEKFRSLFESIDEGFALIEMIYDDQGNAVDYRFLEVNRVFERETGLNGVVGHTVRDLVPDLDRALISDYGRVAQTGEAIRFERLVEEMDNAWFRVYASRVGGQGSRQVAVVFDNITERKRAEQALRASEERLQRMINVPGVGVLLFDESGTLLDANAAFLEMHGYSEEEVTSRTMTWRDLTPPDYVAVSERQMQQLAETGRIGPYEKEYRRKDGSHAWMLFTGASLGDGTIVEYCLDVSDRKRAEEILHRSEARFRHLTNNLPALIWTTDAQGQPTYYNEGWLSYVGQSEERAFIRGAVTAVIHPDDFERAYELWRAAAAAQDVFEVEYRLRRFDGVYEWHLARAVPVLRPDGTIGEWVGSAINIQAQKAAEAAVRESEERYRFLLESAREYAILMMDRAGRITMWSRGAERVFGYTEAEVLGQYGGLIFTNEDRAAGVPEREMQNAATTGRASDDRWHRRKDGTRFWATGVVESLHDGSGQLLGFTKVLRDNTARKAAEDALRESEERFRQLVEAVPDIVFTSSPTGMVDYVSPRREELTGHAPENALGTRLWPQLIHPDDRPAIVAAWDKAVARQQPCVLRHRLQRADGSYRWVIARARPLLDHDGKVVRWFGTVSDVDALTRAEEDLRRLNETLEERVARRTAQVQELAAALTLAEQGERQRVSQVLHDDLQQLLYSQLLRLQMLYERANQESLSEFSSPLARVMTELKQAIEVTRTLVTELSPPVLQTEGLPEALTWLSEHMNQTYGLEVDLKIHERCEPYSPAVRTLLVQMTRELLFNVVKHAGTPRATLVLEREGDHLHLQVADRGTGFDAESALAAPASRKGFGLTNMAERLKLVSGRVDVTSTLGEGSQITLIAPCQRPTNGPSTVG